MSAQLAPRHRAASSSAWTPVGRRGIAVASATGVALTAAVGSTATAPAPTALPQAPSGDFVSNLSVTDSATLVSLDLEWDSGETVGVKAEEPAPEPEPEPVVYEAASRGSEETVAAAQTYSQAPPARLGGVVETAMQYLGYPYVWGTQGPNSFDCSGFTSYIYGMFGVSLSASSYAQATVGYSVSLADAQPGDLFVAHGGGHVAIYMGNGQIIHASSPSTGVTISPVAWYSNFDIRRL